MGGQYARHRTVNLPSFVPPHPPAHPPTLPTTYLLDGDLLPGRLEAGEVDRAMGACRRRGEGGWVGGLKRKGKQCHIHTAAEEGTFPPEAAGAPRHPAAAAAGGGPVVRGHGGWVGGDVGWFLCVCLWPSSLLLSTTWCVHSVLCAAARPTGGAEGLACLDAPGGSCLIRWVGGVGGEGRGGGWERSSGPRRASTLLLGRPFLLLLPPELGPALTSLNWAIGRCNRNRTTQFHDR